MKEMFEKPVMEMIEFDSEDVIATSGCAGYCGFDCNPYCQSVCHGYCMADTTQG